MKRAILYGIAVVALTGCTTTRTIRVPCVTQAQVDELRQAEPPKVSDRLTGKADEDARVLAGSALRLRQWGGSMLGVLDTCAG